MRYFHGQTGRLERPARLLNRSYKTMRRREPGQKKHCQLELQKITSNLAWRRVNLNKNGRASSVGGNSTVGFWRLTSLSAPSCGGICRFLFGPCLFTVRASSWVLLLADRTFLHPPISCYLDVCNITNYWHVLQISHIDMFYNNMTYCVFWWWPPKALWQTWMRMCSFSKNVPMFPTKYIIPMSHRT